MLALRNKIVTAVLLVCVFVVPLFVIGSTMTEYKSLYADELQQDSSVANTALCLGKAALQGAAYASDLQSWSTMQEPAIEYHGFLQKLMGADMISDVEQPVFKQKSGSMFSPSAKLDMDTPANALIKLKNEFQAEGMNTLFIQAPCSTDAYDNSDMPYGAWDFRNENADVFLSNITQGGVANIDLRAAIHDAGWKLSDLYLKTDHHWTPECAFWCFGYVADILEREYGFTVDERFVDENCYTKTVYSQCLLGSLGRRTGQLYAGLDDLTVYSPVFETNFTYDIPSKGETFSGSWDESLLNDDFLVVDDYYKSNAYLTYMTGDFGVSTVENHMNPDGKEVVLFRDSYACLFEPFLANICSKLTILDGRYFDENCSMAEYVKNLNPDLVMLMYNPTVLGVDDAFDFFG